MVLAFLILLTAEILRTNSSFLHGWARRLAVAHSRTHSRRATDPFVIQFWLSLIVLWLPLLFVFTWSAIGSPQPLPAEVYKTMNRQIEQLLPILAGMLAIQIALLVFVFENLVGRYSGQVSQALVRHRAISSVVAFTAFSCVLLWIHLYSDSLNRFSVTPALVGILSLFAFLLTASITVSAMANENAITFAGTCFARRVGRVLKPALPGSPSPIWRLASRCGFDFRSPERAFPFFPPQRSVAAVQKLFMAMLNAAHRSLHDGQQEVFNSCLAGIARIADSYIARRSSYLFSGDEVFGFLNNQFAALIRASAHNDNESLLTAVVRTAGVLGQLAFSIPLLAKKTEGPASAIPVGHPAAPHWFGLLREGFKAGHGLKRSTAASQALMEL
jgi:hypothetical protein